MKPVARIYIQQDDEDGRQEDIWLRFDMEIVADAVYDHLSENSTASYVALYWWALGCDSWCPAPARASGVMRDLSVFPGHEPQPTGGMFDVEHPVDEAPDLLEADEGSGAMGEPFPGRDWDKNYQGAPDAEYGNLSTSVVPKTPSRGS